MRLSLRCIAAIWLISLLVPGLLGSACLRCLDQGGGASEIRLSLEFSAVRPTVSPPCCSAGDGIQSRLAVAGVHPEACHGSLRCACPRPPQEAILAQTVEKPNPVMAVQDAAPGPASLVTASITAAPIPLPWSYRVSGPLLHLQHCRWLI